MNNRKPPTYRTSRLESLTRVPYSDGKRQKYLSEYQFVWYNDNTAFIDDISEDEFVILKRAKFTVTPDGEIIPGEGYSNDDPDMVKAAKKMAKFKKPYRSREKQDIISNKEFDKRIPDEAAAVEFLEQTMWGDAPFCPRCGGEGVYRTKTGKPMSHRCRDCRRHFSVRSGTPMEGSQIDTRTWLLAIRIMHTARKGRSAMEMHKDLGLTWNSCWFLCQRIREAMDVGNEVLTGIIELDETWVGGKEGSKHADKKLHGHWQDGKIPVFGLRDHTGQVVMFPIPGVGRATLEKAILDNVAPGSTIYTDGHPGYRGLPDLGFEHEYVVHEVGEYVRGMATTNGIESVWAVFDRAYMGTFHYISPKHLWRYLNEFSSRLNAGPGNGFKTIARTLRNMRGHRLKWYDLIADPKEQAK